MSESINDYWSLVESAKRAVMNALTNAKLNHGNKAGHIAAKAVLSLLGTTGANLESMYDSIGIPSKRPRYLPPDWAPVCTMKGRVLVHNHDFGVIDDFWFETSWMKDPREKLMDAGQRVLYLENLIHAKACLECTQRKTDAWPKDYQISIREFSELPENTRSVT